MRKRFIASVSLTAVLGVYILMFTIIPQFFSFHRNLLIKFFSALGAFSGRSILPFAEIFAAALLFALAMALLVSLARCAAARSPRPLLRLVAGLMCIALPTGALGFALWPLHAGSSAAAASAYSRAYSIEQLEQLIYSLDASIEAHDSRITFENGRMRLTSQKDELCQRAARAFSAAGISESAAAPKLSMLPEWMSRARIAGMFIPFTGEMLINPDDMDSALPFTILHEIAHSLGAIREDEANLLAFRAAVASGDAEFAWTANLTALRYALNTLRTLDAARFEEILPELNANAVSELSAQGAFSRVNYDSPDALIDYVSVSAPQDSVQSVFSTCADIDTTEVFFMRTGDAGAYDGLTYLLLAAGSAPQ